MIDEIEECEEIKEVEKVSTLEIKQNSFKQDVKVHNPPSLKTLAYQTVKKHPILFFQLHGMELPQEIEIDNKIVKEFIAEKYKQAEKNHALRVEARTEEIKDKYRAFTTDSCFIKSMAFMGGLLFGGIHLGITIPVLNAIDADGDTQATSYALTIVSFIVGNCVGMCFAGKTAKALAECFTPKVPERTVDLEEIAIEYQSIRR